MNQSSFVDSFEPTNSERKAKYAFYAQLRGPISRLTYQSINSHINHTVEIDISRLLEVAGVLAREAFLPMLTKFMHNLSKHKQINIFLVAVCGSGSILLFVASRGLSIGLLLALGQGTSRGGTSR